MRHLAEFGVVFLMFVIGLEFNLPKLRAMRTLCSGSALSQVVLTIVGAIAGNFAAAWSALAAQALWQLSWQAALALLGSAMAMSQHRASWSS